MPKNLTSRLRKRQKDETTHKCRYTLCAQMRIKDQMAQKNLQKSRNADRAKTLD